MALPGRLAVGTFPSHAGQLDKVTLSSSLELHHSEHESQCIIRTLTVVQPTDNQSGEIAIQSQLVMVFNYSMTRQSCQGNAHEKARAFKSFLLKSLFALSLLRQVKNILPRDNRRAKAEPQPLFLSCRKFYTGSSCYLWPHHSKGHYCLY